MMVERFVSVLSHFPGKGKQRKSFSWPSGCIVCMSEYVRIYSDSLPHFIFVTVFPFAAGMLVSPPGAAGFQAILPAHKTVTLHC